MGLTQVCLLAGEQCNPAHPIEAVESAVMEGTTGLGQTSVTTSTASATCHTYPPGHYHRLCLLLPVALRLPPPLHHQLHHCCRHLIGCLFNRPHPPLTATCCRAPTTLSLSFLSLHADSSFGPCDTFSPPSCGLPLPSGGPGTFLPRSPFFTPMRAYLAIVKGKKLGDECEATDNRNAQNKMELM